MATYAAFKHVELYNVGKTKKRVLRPPGGGSSDIFGQDAPSTPRSVKNHMQSNIFASDKGSVKNNGDQPRRGQKNVDSYTRLFGEAERPFTPAKNHMKSSIPFGGENGNGNGNSNGLHASNGRNGRSDNGGSSSSASSISSSTENLKMNGVSKTALEETSDDSLSPRAAVVNGKENDENNESYNSARSTSSKSSEKAQVDGMSPTLQPENNSEDAKTASTSCIQKNPSASSGSQKSTPRNPITGLGLGEDDGHRNRRNLMRRDGNPVTGEGYKGVGAEINTSIPTLNGANQVINKNRIPPGGFSSGLW